jgi:cobalt/nickel transport system permease protein
MHISEGILSGSILLAGAGLTAAGTAVGLKRMEPEQIPATGILSAAFFVASLIHVPAGPVSVHLVLNGLVGVMLGWRAFPAILVGLALQALLFQYGGLTVLGVNTFNMAFPALVCRVLFGWGIRPRRKTPVFVLSAFCAGFFSVLLSGLLVGLSLFLTGDAFLPAARILVFSHFPVMVIEGTLTASCALFLRRVKPDLLEESDDLRLPSP